MGIALTAPGYSLKDLLDSYDGQQLSEEQLFEQGMNLDPKRLAGAFAVPVFVIQGEHDCSSPTSLAKAYLQSITAPHKEFASIPGVGHFAMFTKSEEFLKELVSRVRPVAMEKH